MDITQEAILNALIEEGGKVRNSEFLPKFKAQLNCNDPEKKKRNRDLFKTFVNNVAVVKEIEQTKYIVLRKIYNHLLTQEDDRSVEKKESMEVQLDKVGLSPIGEEDSNVDTNKAPGPNKPEEQVEPDLDRKYNQPQSEIEPAFQKINTMDVKAKSQKYVMPLKSDPEETQQSGSMNSSTGFINTNKTQASAPKRFALPLRMPPVIITTCPEEKTSEVHLAPSKSMLEPPSSPRNKRRPSTDSMAGSSSPQTRRHCKSIKPVDEPKYADTFPLESTEHEWLVSSAVGHWGLVYGHLLSDAQLAEKRDFVSGFTALHWAAKSGNSEMVCKLIEVSRQKGRGVDINTRSFSGYTPLHIAALHDQEYIMSLLVQTYGADRNVRDNCGKKAHHYLHKGVSPQIRELLGAPKPKIQEPEPQKSPQEPETHRHSHTISRLFQNHPTGHKKKPKPRSQSFLTISEDLRGSRGWRGSRDSLDSREQHAATLPRVLSDVFS